MLRKLNYQKITVTAKNKLLFRYWIWPIGYIFLMYFLSSLNISQIQKVNITHLDKMLHIIEYSVFGYLLIRAYNVTASFSYKKLFLLVLLTGFLIGGLDEYYQSFLIYRQSSLLDLTADLIGVVIGISLFRKAGR